MLDLSISLSMCLEKAKESTAIQAPSQKPIAKNMKKKTKAPMTKSKSAPVTQGSLGLAVEAALKGKR